MKLLQRCQHAWFSLRKLTLFWGNHNPNFLRNKFSLVRPLNFFWLITKHDHQKYVNYLKSPEASYIVPKIMSALNNQLPLFVKGFPPQNSSKYVKTWGEKLIKTFSWLRIEVPKFFVPFPWKPQFKVLPWTRKLPTASYVSQCYEIVWKIWKPLLPHQTTDPAPLIRPMPSQHCHELWVWFL